MTKVSRLQRTKINGLSPIYAAEKPVGYVNQASETVQHKRHELIAK